MITVLEACRIATEYDGRPYVIGINEMENGYEIATSYNGEVLDVSCGTFVDKKNGEVSLFFPPDHMNEDSKSIEIPKRYRHR